MSTSFLIKGNGYIFPIDSITKINDTSYMLNLREIATTTPQTSWTPDLSLTFIQGIESITNFRTTDGCPPVVWEVKKYVADSIRTHDTVKIFLSEKITGSSGSAFSRTTLPSNVLNAWVSKGTSLVQVDGMFDGIPGFTNIIGDSILVFTMSNGNNLSTDNYININTTNSLIKDAAGNFPVEANQKVQVKVIFIDVFAIFTGPNPARPTLLHQTGSFPGDMKFQHEINAMNWVRNGQGTVISLRNLARPANPVDAGKVEGTLKIIDVVGNTVNWCKTSNVFETVPNSGGAAPSMNIYWDGLNNEGMMVAPGVYRAVLYINYPSSSKIPNIKVISKIGIRG
jgi:hypothetical protein